MTDRAAPRTTLRITARANPRRVATTTGSLIERPQVSRAQTTLRSILKSKTHEFPSASAPLLAEERRIASEDSRRPVMLLWSFSQRGSQDLHGNAHAKQMADRHRQVTFQKDERLRSVREFPSPRVLSAPERMSSGCGFESNLSSSTTAAPCSADSSTITCDSWEPQPLNWRDSARFVSLKSSSTNSNGSSHSERFKGLMRRIFSRPPRAEPLAIPLCLPSDATDSSTSNAYLDISDDGSSSVDCEASIA